MQKGRCLDLGNSYSNFSLVYDKLINDVDYSMLCDNLLKYCKNYSHKPHLVLDAACGTGNFTKELEKRGIDVIGVDSSPEMLSVARSKLSDNCRLICQDLCSLDLYGTVDTVFCTLDSLNHITDFEQFKQAVKRTALFLEPGGIMIFDVNTVYKHKEVLGDNIFTFEEDNVFTVWENTLCKDNTVNINLDFFIKDKDGKYIRATENFDERAYCEAEILEALESASLKILDKKDFYTFENVTDNSEKIIYITKKE